MPKLFELVRPPSARTGAWKLEVLHGCGLRIDVLTGSETEVDAEMSDMATSACRPSGVILIKSRA